MDDPILYGLVDRLYHLATDWLPESVKDKDMVLAAGLGFTGAYLVTRGLQLVSKDMVDRFVPDFDETWLPRFEKICLYGLPFALAIYGIADSDGLRQVVSMHPTYTSGIVSTYAGGATATIQDLQERSKPQILFGR